MKLHLNMKTIIRLTESDLNKIVKESVSQILNENPAALAMLGRGAASVGGASALGGTAAAAGGSAAAGGAAAGGASSALGGAAGRGAMGMLSNAGKMGGAGMNGAKGLGDVQSAMNMAQNIKSMMPKPQNNNNEEETNESRRYNIDLSEENLSRVLREVFDSTSSYGNFNWNQNYTGQNTQSSNNGMGSNNNQGQSNGGNFNWGEYLNNPNFQKSVSNFGRNTKDSRKNISKNTSNFFQSMKNNKNGLRGYGTALKNYAGQMGGDLKNVGREVGRFANDNPELVQKGIKFLSNMK